MTTFAVFTTIYSVLLSPKAIPYALAALALTTFAWFWRRSFHSSKQRRAIHLALSLWLFGPVAAFIGALFHFMALQRPVEPSSMNPHPLLSERYCYFV
jgi:hypothetical protein